MGLAVALAVLTVLILLDCGPSLKRWAVRSGRSARPRPATAPVVRSGPEAESTDESDELVLVARLLASDLPAARYRQGMADLAARDAAHHPMVVPPQRRES